MRYISNCAGSLRLYVDLCEAILERIMFKLQKEEIVQIWVMTFGAVMTQGRFKTFG